MCSGQVKDLYAKKHVPVMVIGRNSRVQWSEIFENNPKVTLRPMGRVQVLQNGPGMRPYIAGKTEKRWMWRPGKVTTPGEMFFSAEEKAFAEPYRGMTMIEPTTKVAGGNKAWLWDRWQEVARTRDDFVQCGPASTPRLDGVRFVETNFRNAAAVLSACRAFVGPEGALHHAAAALDVPAVVLWSEFISPDVTGYESQRNIRHAGVACGSRVPCDGCKKSMEAIGVDEVLENLKEIA